MKCKKCEGNGCPACLGFGQDVREHVAEFGRIYLVPKLTPERVRTELTVAKQREVKKYCEAMLDLDVLGVK